jgi:hypothetical protein
MKTLKSLSLLCALLTFPLAAKAQPINVWSYWVTPNTVYVHLTNVVNGVTGLASIK